MRPRKLVEHTRKVEAASHSWKLKHAADTGSLRGRIAELEAERDALLAEVEALKEALRKYGWHTNDCNVLGAVYGRRVLGDPFKCTCGCDEALAAIAGGKP